MLFTTLQFLIFFAFIYAIYWIIPAAWRLVWILIVSILFYASWSIPFALHFVLFVTLNYYCVRQLHHKTDPNTRKRWMLAAVIANLANLFLFKYFYLFLKFLHDLSGLTIFEDSYFNSWLFNATGYDTLILPLAISFYTFQLIAYVVDVYRGRISEESSALEFYVFILFFPQLVAGPIMRHGDFMAQLRSIVPNELRARAGMWLILLGLIKKVVLADNLTGNINMVYFEPDHYDWQSNIMAMCGYAARVFLDFSGYTDMARGLAGLMGFDLPRNFTAPFLAASIREFWNRWHVTLSSWLRDYIYFTMGGNRRGATWAYINLIFTFTLGGLWHGANYTFIAWGFTCGMGLAVERFIMRNFFKNSISDKPALNIPATLQSRLKAAGKYSLGVGYSFGLFLVGIFFFPAPSIAESWQMIQQVCSLADGVKTSPHNLKLGGVLVLTFGLNLLQLHQHRLGNVLRRYQYSLLALATMTTLILLGRYAPSGTEYIYFQF